MWATGVNALFALTIFPIAYIFLKEQRATQQSSSVVLQNASQQLKTIIRAKDLWMALLFMRKEVVRAVERQRAQPEQA